MAWVVGFDTEYVSGGGEGPQVRDHKQNRLLSYQFHCLNTATDAEGGGVEIIDGRDARSRRYLSTILSRVIDAAIAEGIFDLETAPRTSRGAVIIDLCAHFTRADLPAFADWSRGSIMAVDRKTGARQVKPKGLKASFDAVRGTFTTSTRPMVMQLNLTRGPLEVSVRLHDTMLLAPATHQTLAGLGELVGVPKIVLPEVVDPKTGEVFPAIQRMDLLLNQHPELFKKYALTDAVIAARYLAQIMDFCQNVLRIDKMPTTLGSAGVQVFKNLDARYAEHLGYETKLNGRRGDIKSLYAAHFAHIANCYFGGRNEAYTIGPSSGRCPAIDIDLCGAYTTGMAAVLAPDWDAMYATTDLAEVVVLRDRMSFAHVRFKFPTSTRFPGLPVRAGDAGLLFPFTGESWCTGPELVVALNAGAEIEVIHAVVIPTPLDGERVFEKFTHRVNELRASAEKKSLFERLAKEVGNSLYGKTAQAVDQMKSAPAAGAKQNSGKTIFDSRTGTMGKLPPSGITSPAVAAFTTGLLRAALAELLNGVPPSQVVHTATTDGILFEYPDAESFEPDQKVMPEDLGLETGPIMEWMSDLRRVVDANEDPRPLEVKTTVRRVVTVKTRGTYTLEPTPDRPVVLARAGYKLPNKIEDPLEQSLAWCFVYAGRAPRLQMKFERVIDLRTQWVADADLVPTIAVITPNLEPDFKRSPVALTERLGLIATDQTKPWHSLEEFRTNRGLFDRWRKDRLRVLKKLADWADFTEFAATAPDRKALRSSGRSGRTPFAENALRALVAGKYGAPAKRVRGKNSRIIAAFAEAGVKITKKTLANIGTRNLRSVSPVPLRRSDKKLAKVLHETFPEFDVSRVGIIADEESKATRRSNL